MLPEKVALDENYRRVRWRAESTFRAKRNIRIGIATLAAGLAFTILSAFLSYLDKKDSGGGDFIIVYVSAILFGAMRLIVGLVQRAAQAGGETVQQALGRGRQVKLPNDGGDPPDNDPLFAAMEMEFSGDLPSAVAAYEKLAANPSFTYAAYARIEANNLKARMIAAEHGATAKPSQRSTLNRNREVPFEICISLLLLLWAVQVFVCQSSDGLGHRQWTAAGYAALVLCGLLAVLGIIPILILFLTPKMTPQKGLLFASRSSFACAGGTLISLGILYWFHHDFVGYQIPTLFLGTVVVWGVATGVKPRRRGLKRNVAS